MVQSLSGSIVQSVDNSGKVLVCDVQKTRSLGVVLPQQAVRVFVESSLVGTVRVGKVDRHAQRAAERFVPGKLRTVVDCQRV